MPQSREAQLPGAAFPAGQGGEGQNCSQFGKIRTWDLTLEHCAVGSTHSVSGTHPENGSDGASSTAALEHREQNSTSWETEKLLMVVPQRVF